MKSYALRCLVVLFCLLPAPVASAASHTVMPWHGNRSAAVSLTFDDGYLSQHEIAVPALNERGFKGTFFIYTGFTDYLDGWDWWRSAARDGHEIASHTMTHPYLTVLPLSEADHEIAASQALINEKISGQRCLTFAYPYGVLNTSVKALDQKYYIAARGTGASLNSATSDMFNEGAYDAAGYTSAQMQALTDKAASLGKWLIPCYHSFSPGEYGGWSPDQFTSYLEYLRERPDLWVAPFATVAKYIKERTAAKLTVAAESGDTITLILTDTLDNTVFDTPLTLRSVVPSGWHRVRVQQGTDVTAVEPVTEGDVQVIYYDALPDRGVIDLVAIPDVLPPVTVDDTYSVDMNSTLTVAAPGVLSNDGSPGGGALTAELVGGVSHGTLVLTADGSFVYSPASDYAGSDSFRYQARSGSLVSLTASVNLSVVPINRPPAAVSDSYSTVQNTPLMVSAPGILFNDRDPDGSVLTAYLISEPHHGSLSLNSNGSFNYTPHTDYTGDDVFTYQVYDGGLMSSAAAVTVTVAAPVNQPPVASGDNYSMTQNTELAISAPGVLSNDRDFEGGLLTAHPVIGPDHGTLELHADGSFVYTPLPGYTGSDSFLYQANDGGLMSGAVPVNITVIPVNLPPVAADDSYSMYQDTVLSILPPGILANDSDPEKAGMTASLMSPPSHGTLALAGNGSFTYTPAAGYSGSDSFTYLAGDGVQSSSATVRITIFSTVLFSDDMTRTEPALLSPWTGLMGMWKAVNGSLQGTGSLSEYYGYAFVPAPSWNNYIVKGRIQFQAGTYGGGLGGRVNRENGAHYGVWIYPDGSMDGANIMKLVKFRSWTSWSGIAMKQVSLPSVGTDWHDLRLVFNGSRIQVYYDGVMKLDVIDTGFDSRPAYVSGGISADVVTIPGLSDSYGMAVDDIVVTLIPD